MTNPPPLPLPLPLHCPTCTSPLSPKLHCSHCDLTYPRLNNIPWLFREPDLELARWEARAHKELQDLSARKQACDESLQARSETTPGTDHTRARLWLLAQAYADQLICLTDLLAPLLADQPSSDRTTYTALKTAPLADTTTLFSYATNLFRDWVWGDEENAQTIDMLGAVAIGSLGTTLVLGAGGGRLAWDLANGPATAVTAVDINPFTSLAAAAVTSATQETATQDKHAGPTLWEFPLAAVTSADVAIKRVLAAPTKTNGSNLQWLLADARALPFALNSFDTVVTPWFTDVVQQAPATTARQINSLLKTGGRWLNFGSVAFADADPADCLLLEELSDLVAANGFATPVVFEERGPYLCSPHSRYGRQELLHAFAAEKVAESPAADVTDDRPVWLQDLAQPVPALESFQAQAMATQVHAYLMSLIDGERSVIDIAQVLEQRQLMSAREAVPVVQEFLAKMLSE